MSAGRLFTVSVDLEHIVDFLRVGRSAWTQFFMEHDLPADAVLVHVETSDNNGAPDQLKLRFYTASDAECPTRATWERRFSAPPTGGQHG